MKNPTLLIISGIATLLFVVIMLLHGAPLKVEGVSPRGIIDLELAGTMAEAIKIYEAWHPDLTAIAMKNTAIDFLFLISYGIFLSACCYALSRYYRGFIQKLGIWLSRLMIVAAAFDALENILMLSTLSAHFKKEIIASTYMFASIKFILVGLGIVYVACAGLAKSIMPKKKLQHLSEA